MKKIIGITGRIGAGKSSLTSYLEKSFSVFSVDQIQKDLYQPQKELWKMVNEHFSDFIVEGNVDFKAIKSGLIEVQAFKHDFQRKVINILIPHIKKITKPLTGLIFIEIPYINSKELSDFFDFVVIVKAEDSVRLERVIARDNITKKEAKQWIDSYVENMPLEKSIIIKNNSDMKNLEKQLTEVFKCIVL